MSRPPPDDTEATDLPRTVAEAVSLLVRLLDQAQLEEIAATPEDDLIEHHFGFGAVIREEFGLHGANPALLASCAKPNADDASMVIIKALWARLRH